MAADAWSLAAALAVLLALRLAAALLPLWAVARMRTCSGHRALLLASRFAGGVLLATALLHMLPEAREQLPEHAWGGCLAELLVGAGFLAIYVLEEAWHGRSQPAPDPPPLAPQLQLPALTTVHQKPPCASTAAPACPWPPASRIAPADSTQHLLAEHGSGGGGGCTWVLLLALGVHSLLEGFALGLQTTARDTWLLLAALSVHAVPLLLCVGAKVSASGARRCSAVSRLSALAAAAPVGGVLGAVAGGAALGGAGAAGALQALAAGSLLFAALAEGLAGGGAGHSHHHQVQRSLPGAAVALLGFALIAAMQLTVVHHHHHHDGDEVVGNLTSLSNSSGMEGHAHL